MSKSGSNTYIRVVFRGVRRKDEDVLTSLLFECGCQGISESVPFKQPDLTFEAIPIWNDPFDFEAYFFTLEQEELLSRLSNSGFNLEYAISEEKNQDWLSEWKKSFVPFRLAGDFWIVPSWHLPPPECRKPIRIDPGMAFGTGTHATTQLAAEILFRESSRPSPQAILDVGTGTGILAIMAHLIWPSSQIEAIDIDPEARRVARENLADNACSSSWVTDRELSEIGINKNNGKKEEFDLIIANIIDGVLIALKDQLVSKLAPRGRLIVSGILLEREEKFRAEFIEPLSRPVLLRLEKDEWVAYLLGPSTVVESVP